MTPLYDATGLFITRIGEDLAALPEDERPGRVICVIMTDGHENASTEWTSQRVHAVIREQQDKYSWDFIFIGASTTVRWPQPPLCGGRTSGPQHGARNGMPSPNLPPPSRVCGTRKS